MARFFSGGLADAVSRGAILCRSGSTAGIHQSRISPLAIGKANDGAEPQGCRDRPPGAGGREAHRREPDRGGAHGARRASRARAAQARGRQEPRRAPRRDRAALRELTELRHAHARGDRRLRRVRRAALMVLDTSAIVAILLDEPGPNRRTTPAPTALDLQLRGGWWHGPSGHPRVPDRARCSER